MAQHDYNIGDQNGFDFLVDLNNALSAIATNNAGSSEPNTTFAHMLWFDTNNDLMKMRNEANSAWVIVAKKDGSGWTPYASGQAIDNRYAHRSNNLSDLGSATTARANLGAAEDSSDPNFTNDPNAAARRGLVQQKIINLILDTIPGLVAAELHASGSAPMYACRAWVNFKGTGTVAIRASGNVSSITDNGTGDYFVNFTIRMLEANYCTTGSTERSISEGAGDFGVRNGSITRSSVGVRTTNGAGQFEDATTVSVAIFR